LKMLRRMIRYFFVFLASAFLMFAGHLLATGPKPTILMYHGVGDPDIKNKTLNISLEAFEKQMAFFYGHGYRVISLGELVAGLKGNKKFPWKTIVLTLDDGYENNYTHAYPVLKKYGFPATIFVVTDFLGQEKAAMDQPGPVRFLSLSQLLEMRSSGLITAGTHSRSHPFLPSLGNNPAAMREEIFGSKRDLEGLLKEPVSFFCYPRGGYTDSVKEMVRAAGYSAAVTTFTKEKGRGLSDLWALKRVKMSESCVPPLILFLETSGYYVWLKELTNE
jgi:peptidoglycan/xylan/chitin deacetylase (PgdA/CDA1 family)